MLLLFGRSSFQPNSVSGLSLWLDSADASTITVAAGVVSQWDDKSANGYDMVQGVGASQPAWTSVTSGMTFDGTDDYFENADAGCEALFSISQAHTIFVVFTADTSPAGQITMIGMNITNNDRFTIAHRSDFVCISHFDGTVNVDPLSRTQSTPSSPAILTYKWDGAGSSGDATLTVGGATSDGTNGAFASGIGTFTLGARTGGGLPWDGKIYEMIVYNTELGTSVTAAVEAYLTTKWGL